jgi:16S rRNA (cytosine1402-N4)-methyltransferase
LIWKYGEERAARAIAKAIVAERRKVKELTTDWLAKVILSVRRKAANDRTHPATRTFQALRMAVNDELGNLEAALPQAAETLSLGGRLVVISFHSLEDRIVKNFLRTNANGNIQMLTNEPVTPTEEEVARNPRARSAKMRVAVKKA